MTDPHALRGVEPGDWVRVRALPYGLEALPAASRELFQYCLGRTFRVVERDAQGLLVLGLGVAADARFGGFMNDSH